MNMEGLENSNEVLNFFAVRF